MDIESAFLRTKFKQAGHALKPGTMFKILSQYPESRTNAATAQGTYYVVMTFGVVGRFLIGCTAVQPIFGKPFNAPFFLAEAGSAMIGLVFGKLSEIKLWHAVKAYSWTLGKTSLSWGLAPGQLGLAPAIGF